MREIIESKHFPDLATNPFFSNHNFKAVPPKYRALIPEYIKDYVSLNQFAAEALRSLKRISNCGEFAIFDSLEFERFVANPLGAPMP